MCKAISYDYKMFLKLSGNFKTYLPPFNYIKKQLYVLNLTNMTKWSKCVKNFALPRILHKRNCREFVKFQSDIP